MSLTNNQYGRIKNHPSLVWLKAKSDKKQAVPAATIKAKILEAMSSDEDLSKMCTDGTSRGWRIRWGRPGDNSTCQNPFLRVSCTSMVPLRSREHGIKIWLRRSA